VSFNGDGEAGHVRRSCAHASLSFPRCLHSLRPSKMTEVLSVLLNRGMLARVKAITELFSQLWSLFCCQQEEDSWDWWIRNGHFNSKNYVLKYAIQIINLLEQTKLFD
jgi:hypothetical protein